MTTALAPSSSYRDEARAVIKHHSKSFSLAALLLGPELRDEESAVGGGHGIEEVEADHRDDPLDAGLLPEDLLDLRGDRGGAVLRCPLR